MVRSSRLSFATLYKWLSGPIPSFNESVCSIFYVLGRGGRAGISAVSLMSHPEHLVVLRCRWRGHARGKEAMGCHRGRCASPLREVVLLLLTSQGREETPAGCCVSEGPADAAASWGCSYRECRAWGASPQPSQHDVPRPLVGDRTVVTTPGPPGRYCLRGSS